MTTIQLSEDLFEHDMCFISIANDMILRFNIIDEDIAFVNGNVKLNVLNVELLDADGSYVKKLTNIIGLSDDYISIKTDYKQFEGENLSKDNMIYCTIEVEDE